MSTETNCENYENYKNESIIKINWSMLSRNPEAIHLLEQYPDRICWKMLCTNPSPAAIRLLVQNQDKIYWEVFSLNPGAIPLLEAYPDKIHWSNLSSNPSEAAFRLLEKNQDKIDWSKLSLNQSTAAMRLLLEKNPDKIDWYNLSQNPAAINRLEMQVRMCSGYLKPQYSGEELRAMAMERRRKASALIWGLDEYAKNPDYEPTDGGEGGGGSDV
jgi:hypothetical protein